MKDLTPVVNEFTPELTSRGFVINKGWSDELASTLAVKSREDQVVRSVPRDATERFTNVESAERWYVKTDRLVYSLGEAATLSGLIWFGYSPSPDLELTIRLLYACTNLHAD